MATHTLLTGGAGFIGSSLARHLVEAGHRLVVLDKLTYAGNRENLRGLDLELVVGDVCDKDLVQELVAESDIVIHAAAESHVTRSHQNAGPFIRTNIEGSRTVVQAAAEAQTPHCIHLSTDEVFGPATKGHRFGIDDTHRPSNAYAASKASAEAFLQVIRQRSGYPCTVVRMTNNYGPRQHAEKAIPCWIGNALKNKSVPIHGTGTAQRDWLHVDDFSRGILQILSHGQPGETHHFSGGNSLSNRVVAEKIAAMCGGAPIQEGPERPGQDARYALNDDATRSQLNWAPIQNFDAGLQDLINTFRDAEDS
jgi:dTDP-glucose 4,6-dehydratase